MRLRLTMDDVLFFVAVIALIYFRNWWAALAFAAVLAYVIYHYVESKKKEPALGSNAFLIDRDDIVQVTADLDVDIQYRPTPNRFRIDSNFDTRFTDREYEFRIDGTGVFARLIALQTADIDEKQHYEVRDGVVLEADMRQMVEGRSAYIKNKTPDRIKNLKTETEWSEMTTIAWGGLKYFLISKKLPRDEGRRYLRQELERLKSGCTAFFKEAEKLGLERDDESKFVDRLRVREGKPVPPDEKIRQLFEKIESFGITQVEYSSGKRLCGVLQELLGD
jgi:hypothetical protein